MKATLAMLSFAFPELAPSRLESLCVVVEAAYAEGFEDGVERAGGVAAGDLVRDVVDSPLVAWRD